MTRNVLDTIHGGNSCIDFNFSHIGGDSYHRPLLAKFEYQISLCSPIDQYDFFLLLRGLKRSPVAAPELANFLLLAFLARDLAPPFVLFVLHIGQYHTSGIAVLFTLAHARCTQVAQELHSIIGRPAYGFLQ